MAYQIITDGSCDLSPELSKAKNLKVVPFYVSFDGMKYEKEIEDERQKVIEAGGLKIIGTSLCEMVDWSLKMN